MRQISFCVLVALWVWGMPTPTARACSCMSGYSRSEVTPQTGATAVHVRSGIRFLVSGFSGPATEFRMKKRYVLQRESPLKRLVIRHIRLGNLVRLVPAKPLKPNTWYRVMAPTAYGKRTVVLTRFKTGKVRNLPRMPAAKLSRTGMCAAPAGGARPGRCYFSQSVSVTTPRLRLTARSRLLFHWEVEHKVGTRWVALQGSPFLERRAQTRTWCSRGRVRRRRVFRAQPISSVRLSNSQCAKGPTVPRGTQQLRIVLVRVDGKRKNGPVLKVHVP